MAGLSKSRFLVGLRCSKRLWWMVHEPEAPELAGEVNAGVRQRGRALGMLAREYVPGGVLIDLPHSGITARIEATALALAEGAPVVYEASFAAGGAFASVDILERRCATFRGWLPSSPRSGRASLTYCPSLRTIAGVAGG